MYIRLYSGFLKRGDMLLNTTLKISEKAMRLLRVRADEYVEVDEIKAGDIVAVSGLKLTRSGDTVTK